MEAINILSFQIFSETMPQNSKWHSMKTVTLHYEVEKDAIYSSFGFDFGFPLNLSMSRKSETATFENIESEKLDVCIGVG